MLQNIPRYSCSLLSMATSYIHKVWVLWIIIQGLYLRATSIFILPNTIPCFNFIKKLINVRPGGVAGGSLAPPPPLFTYLTFYRKMIILGLKHRCFVAESTEVSPHHVSFKSTSSHFRGLKFSGGPTLTRSK